MRSKIHEKIDDVGVVGPAWETLRAVLKEIVNMIPECEKKEEKKGKK